MEMRSDLLDQRLLDGEIFGDGFDHPIAFFQSLQVVFKVAGRDQRGAGCVVECSGLGLEQICDGICGDAAAGSGGAGRDDIEKNHRHSRVGEVGRDARAHGSGSENGGATQQWGGLGGGRSGCAHRVRVLRAGKVVRADRVFSFQTRGQNTELQARGQARQPTRAVASLNPQVNGRPFRAL